VIEPIVVLVGKVVVPVSNEYFHSECFEVGLHVVQAFHAGYERIGGGVVDGVDEVASDGGVIGLVHGMRGEVFARHGWVVVVAVDVEFFQALEGLLRELFEIDAKTFSFGCS